MGYKKYNLTYRVKDGGYQYIISYKTESGKWKQKARQGFATLEEAELASIEGLVGLKIEGELPKPQLKHKRKYFVTFRIKDGGYQYIIGYKDHSGKWRQKVRQGYKTLEEAKIAASERLEHFKHIKFIEGLIDGIEKPKRLIVTSPKKDNIIQVKRKYRKIRNEIWQDINGYEGLYKISNKGRVFSVRQSKIFSLSNKTNGYVKVALTKNGKISIKLVHRLVAGAFIPNHENKPAVDHINTIRNDNRVENLRWVTYKENMNNELTKENMRKSKIKHKARSKYM